MGFFGNKTNEGGLMDVIRCDEPSYLIWKWRPDGALDANTTRKENSIRYGSSLRVKDGEVAVFVYQQKDGTVQDFIEGPYDDTIKTANFPILTSIVGLGFGGKSPFQAEVYFINLAKIIQIKFGVPFFDIPDPRFLDFSVPVAVRGSVNFRITDYKEFIKLHRLINFDLDSFSLQVRDAVCKYVKNCVLNYPVEKALPVIQIERRIAEINEFVEEKIKKRFSDEFGVTVTSVDISAIELDKDCEDYSELMKVTKDVTVRTVEAQTVDMEERLRIQREEMQRAQKLQTENSNLAAHQVNIQKDIGIAGAEALGKMGQNGAMGINLGNGGGINPTSMMAGMAMGSAIGQNMAGMINNSLSGINQTVPPVPPKTSGYNVAVNGQSTGPYDMTTLSQMAANGQFTSNSLVWKTGMANWAAAGTVPELSLLFQQNPPPIPPVPPEV